MSNYYLGNDPSRWQTNVRASRSVHLPQLYDGIDLVCYGNQRSLEYDFIVAPRADASKIRLDLDGADALSIDSAGALVAATPSGTVCWRAPKAYQTDQSGRHEVAARYAIRGNEATISLGGYDHAKQLVIDPEFVYSTYVGGSDYDNATSVACDSLGYAVITGFTYSTDFPLKNAFETAHGNAIQTGFASRYAPNGELVYSTYYSGGRNAYPKVVCDGLGNAYLLGGIESPDLPCKNAFQPGFGGVDDATVVKLDPQGQLVYATYLGGSAQDIGTALAVSQDGQLTVVGTTRSSDFFVCNALLPTFQGGDTDGFVTRIAPNGRCVSSTYWGGSGSDSLVSVAIDRTGASAVYGMTNSGNYPTLNAFQSHLVGTNGDCCVARFAADGTVAFSTYLGGGNLWGQAGQTASQVATDSLGCVIVVGSTNATDFPTKNAYISSTPGAWPCPFISKFRRDGNLIFSTFFGHDGTHQQPSVAIGPKDEIAICGYTNSSNFPAINAVQPSRGGIWDTFVAKLSADGQPVFSTYLGGSYTQFPSGGISFDSRGNLAVAGYSASDDFPTKDALQAKHPGSYDVFITSYDPSGQILFSTPFGGGGGTPGMDVPTGISNDPAGDIVVAGSVASPNNWPLQMPTANAAQATFAGGYADGFLTKIALQPRLISLELNPNIIRTVGDPTSATVWVSGEFKDVTLTFDPKQFGQVVIPPIKLTKGNGKWTAVLPTQFLKPAKANPVTVTATGVAVTGAKSTVIATLGVGVYSESILDLQSIDMDGKIQTVDGIACDNLDSTPPAERDCLSIPIPSDLDGVDIANNTVSVRSKSVGSDTHNAGTIILNIGGGKRWITYYPPSEFNPNQVPAHSADLYGPSTRDVELLVTGTRNGQLVSVKPKTIKLVRPPVILVHGINSSASAWGPDAPDSLYQSKVARMPLVALEHGDVLHGNGPVELAAYRLKQLIDNTKNKLWAGSFQAAAGKNWKFNDYLGFRLACRRVDIVAWSYGGVIARWYLASDGSSESFGRGPDGFGWYRQYPHRGFQYPSSWNLASGLIYSSWFPDCSVPGPVTYGKDVRKLITLGSMWRGVPVANYANEGNFSDGPGSLNEAPVTSNLYGHNNIGGFLDAFLSPGHGLVPRIPTKVPSLQVMAVDSQWMKRLCGLDSAGAGHPFIRQDVAYGSVAGDSSNIYTVLFSGLSSYIDSLQQPTSFPYLLLDCRDNQDRDFTDGIVPAWSSAIPGSYSYAHCSHDKYATNPEARNYVLQWLNNALLPTGDKLIEKWSDPASLANADNTKHWPVSAQAMAPFPQSELYKNGRIAPNLIYQRTLGGDLQVSAQKDGKIDITWITDYPCTDEQLIVYPAGTPSPLGSWSRQVSATRSHQWSLSQSAIGLSSGLYVFELRSSAVGSEQSQAPFISVVQVVQLR